MKRISAALLILSSTIALPVSAQSANDLFCRGTYELSDDRYGEAINSFSQAIRSNPRFSSAYFYRGIVHHHKQRYREAIANYNQALTIGSEQSVTILENRASALASLGDYKQALEDLKLAIRYKPNDEELQRAIAFTFLKLGSRKSAIAILEKMTNTYFRDGDRRAYLATRDELQKVRSGGMINHSWGFGRNAVLEKGCP